MKYRKTLQLHVSETGMMHVLCEDGTMWRRHLTKADPTWDRIEGVPEETAEEKAATAKADQDEAKAAADQHKAEDAAKVADAKAVKAAAKA